MMQHLYEDSMTQYVQSADERYEGELSLGAQASVESIEARE